MTTMARRHLAFTVRGIPGAQGSKRHVGHGVMIESSKKVKPWRSDVKAAAEDAIRQWETDNSATWEPLAAPVKVYAHFTFARPRSHYRTGRNAHLLRVDAPEWVTSRSCGDLDKLCRSTFDALTAAGVLADDSLIASLAATKAYSEHSSGMTIGIGDLT